MAMAREVSSDLSLGLCCVLSHRLKRKAKLVYYVDVVVKEPGEPMESIIRLHKPSIEVWLSDWLDGKDLWHEVWS
jgi:hypothetical protein